MRICWFIYFSFYFDRWLFPNRCKCDSDYLNLNARTVLSCRKGSTFSSPCSISSVGGHGSVSCEVNADIPPLNTVVWCFCRSFCWCFHSVRLQQRRRPYECHSPYRRGAVCQSGVSIITIVIIIIIIVVVFIIIMIHSHEKKNGACVPLPSFKATVTSNCTKDRPSCFSR